MFGMTFPHSLESFSGLVAFLHHAPFSGPSAEYPRPRQAVCPVSLLLVSRLNRMPIPSAVDYAVKIRVNPQQTGIDLNVKHSMVPRVLCTYTCILTVLRIRLTKSVRRASDNMYPPPNNRSPGQRWKRPCASASGSRTRSSL